MFLSQLKKRYGIDPLDVQSLIPPLPLPGPERAAEALAAITDCFQAIADSQAAKDAAAAKVAKPSMFSFRATATAIPAAAPAASKPVDSAKSAQGGSSKGGLISALAAETSSAKHAAPEALPADSSLLTQVLVPGETVAASRSESGLTAREDEGLVAEWDERQRELSSDQKPVTLAEGFKYW